MRNLCHEMTKVSLVQPGREHLGQRFAIYLLRDLGGDTSEALQNEGK